MSARLTIGYDGSQAAATAVRTAAALFTHAHATMVTVPAPPLGSADHLRQRVPTMSYASLESTLAGAQARSRSC